MALDPSGGECGIEHCCAERAGEVIAALGPVEAEQHLRSSRVLPGGYVHGVLGAPSPPLGAERPARRIIDVSSRDEDVAYPGAQSTCDVVVAGTRPTNSLIGIDPIPGTAWGSGRGPGTKLFDEESGSVIRDLDVAMASLPTLRYQTGREKGMQVVRRSRAGYVRDRRKFGCRPGSSIEEREEHSRTGGVGDRGRDPC